MNEIPDEYSEESQDREHLNEKDLMIRALNDKLRKTGIGGKIMMTPGINGLEAQTRSRVFMAIRRFDDFNEDNAPFGTHEFGGIETDGVKAWFKVDCYDKDMQYGSEDPSDPDVTTRVMTVLLPEEY